ncbi:DEAD/DEAH box helicase [Enteractinococcus coprophilus]|uniref:Superfamily II DNA or RNA helicase n=1 Tax=Enteractinococcus coprophilus TaxID=1027633 RepID=A0A543AIE6_9MICC|nr:DEAD/DEAH box helicase [Enteractinococcus coprophilus]TQL72351.1 superfamily II DNA or RNA helicase [Enteractinococcus coprophilus]
MSEALFQIGEDLPPALPERAAWGTAPKLRQWQQEALELYFEKPRKDFMTVATPGAGKTTFALRVAKMLHESGVISRITVVAPTEHLKSQWADSAARIGLAIDPNFKNSDGRHGSEYMGVALTYAQVASKPILHRNRTEAAKTLVILDEIHHGGDALSWGESIREAFEPAARRLSLTGTPFRSDDAQIPFVDYVDDGTGVLRSRADYTYGYGPALRDHVVRPVIFMAYSGQMRWQTSTGEVMEAQLGEAATKDMTANAWRTALNPKGEWIPAVLKAADLRLTEVRRNVPDAGGLVIATDHEDARAYADTLERLSGEKVITVLSDDPTASSKIEEFSDGAQRWMVAVRMVSEGVDVPRLCVGVYATSTSTPMFFAQAVGRFVRSRRRGETASVFLPSVPKLMELANEMEEERDHALELDTGVSVEDLEDAPEEDLMREANREESASSSLSGAKFQALESQALFDKVLFDGGEFGTGGAIGSAEELDFLGIPGLLDPDQVSMLLKQRQAEQLRRQPRNQPKEDATVVDHRQMKELRKKLSSSVSAWSARTGTPHGVIHNQLREISGGPAVAQATREQIEQRLETLQGWFVGRK